ncbi:hypothetical protein SAMN02910298_02259 [Pseudobutyrivibrio sp. YE44]|uniref:hypothetical protein n=1 Tax=Pseudobutyrivibrio sp. YE44 TaxID=1520802 RepID=UPI00088730CC|nr:hypothetical protein [Pseudobutyrivibrio sp. YE44]SDB45176.1 hypothetical protein SAMN02910298_02259 [Pseudobutyrivibrio sp. YE44]
MASANVLRKYAELTVEKRVDYICRNYASFMGIVESYTEGLIYMIEEEQDFNRREERGDLGVRVGGGFGHSDPTANKAIRNVSLRDAIINCDFEGGVLEDTDHEEQFMRDAAVLRRMRRDYKLFNSQMHLLAEEEMTILQTYLSGNKDLNDLADELNIQYDSAKCKIYNIKRKLKKNVVSFASLSYVN